MNVRTTDDAETEATVQDKPEAEAPQFLTTFATSAMCAQSDGAAFGPVSKP